jgi:hypothetical protein
VSGSYELVMPREDRIPTSKQSALEEWHRWWEGKTRHNLCEGQGGSDHVEHAAHHVQKAGFEVAEYEWYEDQKGRKWIEHVHPIECSSVYEWVLKDNLRGLAGCDFDPGTYGEPYTLSSEGPQLQHYKLHLANIAAHNNNFEGISPMRPSLFLIKLKQLLLRIIGVGVEGFGVPLKSVGFDPDAMSMILGDQMTLEGADVTDEKKRQAFFEAIKRVRAVDRNTITKPFGIALEMLSVEGSFPTVVLDVLQYLDTLMAMPYSNEGGFLGLQSSVGSYKLGEIKDKQDLSSSFYYARNILKPWNRITKIACREAVGDLPEYPYWTFRLDGLTDDGRWIDDVAKVFGGIPAPDYPQGVRRALEQKLELEDGALDSVEEEADSTDNQLMYKLTNAVTNGVIPVTEQTVRFAYSVLGMPSPSPSAVQKAVEQWEEMKAQDGPASGPGAPDAVEQVEQMLMSSAVEVEHTAGTEDVTSRLQSLARHFKHAAEEAVHIGGDHDHDDGPVIIEHVAEHVTLLEHAEQQFDAERAEKAMDAFEDEIAEEFRSIAWEQKTEWGREFNDAITSNTVDFDEVDRAIVRYRKKYLPRYIAAARAALTKAAQEGVATQLAEYVDVADDFASDLDNDAVQQIKLRADSIAREMFNRAHGMLVDRMSEFEQGDQRVGLEVPKKSTIASQIAPRGVSSAFNRGRTQVQTALKARAQIEGLKGQAYATRISVLDDATCDRCEKLDGVSVVVGSKQYYNIQPPNKCEGRHRCRCAYVLTLSNNSDREGFERMMQKIRDNGGRLAA